MGVIITSTTDSFKIYLNGNSTDRKFTRTKYESIRSLVKDTDDECVEFVFNDSAIQYLNYTDVDSIDGDNDISSQDILYDKLEAKIFGA